MIRAKVTVGGRLWKTPMILGQFLENMGENIYGGLWDPTQPASNLLFGGVRKDVAELVKSLRPPIIRFPGGCAADYYHWRLGVGPREKRPTRPNYHWRWAGGGIGKPETYQFGTDEFLKFCRYVGAEPMITVNAGTGTPEEAAAWVEYCNGGRTSEHGRLRASFGHPEPWGVKYWCIGNEQWGPWERGASSPEEYGRKFLRYARAMRKVDPDIKLVACGLNWEFGESIWPLLLPSILLRPLYEPLRPFFNPTNWRNWNERLLRVAEDEIDILSLHDYFPDSMRLWSWRPKPTPENFYWIVTGNIKTELMLRRVQERVKIPVCLDEWNVRYDLPSHRRCNYSVAEGIYSACMLNSLLRIERLFCANYAQLVNALGMVITHERGAYLTPTGHIFRMYAETLRAWVIETCVESPTLTVRGLKANYVDAAATGDDKGISLYLVNRSYDEPAEVEVKGEIEKFLTVGIPGPFAINTPENPEHVKIEPGPIQNNKIILPPHTANCLLLR